MKKVLYLSIISILTACTLNAQVDSVQFPVSLSSFEAGLSNNTTVLKWKTACYISYANFKIERSSNGITFSTITSFTADRLRCQQPFTFIDSADHAGNIFYRINAGDIDGHFFHSKIINISNKKIGFEILSVYPTVINSNAIIVLSSPFDSKIKMNLVNSGGISVKHYKYNLKKGVSNFNLDFANVSKGKYWIITVDLKGNQKTVAVIRQ